MKKCTPRELVLQHVGGKRITENKLRRALCNCCTDGWMPIFAPLPHDAECELAMVRADHPYAPIARKVFEQSMEDPTMPVAFALDEITGPEHEGPITEQITRCLGGHGLLIVDAAPGSISLVGTSPLLALLVNRLRHRPHPRGVLRQRIVQAALPLPQRPQRLRTEMLLNAAVTLDNLDIEADGLLDENRRTSSLRSKWLLAERMNQDNGEGDSQHD